MNAANTKPRATTGALLGLLITMTAVAVMGLGWVLLGLPFLPFDLFDFAARVTPGALITFVIDRLVSVLLALPVGELSSAAKTAEQIMAVVGFIAAGAVAGALFFWLMNRWSDRPRVYGPGIALGVIVGLPLIAINLATSISATADPLLGLMWLAAVILGWGVALAWVYHDLAALPLADNDAFSLNRRQFLVRVGGATATVTVLGTSLASIINTLSSPQPESVQVAGDLPSVDASDAALPNADQAVQAVPGTRPEYTPLDRHYRIDINAAPPSIDAEEWRLTIGGLVANPLSLSLDELRDNFSARDEYITMACISNQVGGDLIGTTRWTGVPMREILEAVQPDEGAVALRITAVDGFDEYVSMDLLREDERIMLAYAWDGQPLRQKHGFPLRIHIPDRFGMKQPKWITEMTFVDAHGEGYWVRRGWSAEAIARSTAVIDTVAVNYLIPDGEGYRVPVGGIAWAGDRGVSRVEVRVDSGEWQAAELRQPLSEVAWTVWRYEWPFEEGNHTFEVRCFEGDGTPQISQRASTRPDGATGIHDRQVRLLAPDETSA